MEDVFPDGWTMRSGDRAGGLTPGVAAKREETLPTRAAQGDQDLKAASEEDQVYLKKKTH